MRARGAVPVSILLGALSIIAVACGSSSPRAQTQTQSRSSTSRVTTSTTVAPSSTARPTTTTTTSPPTVATTTQPPATAAPPTTAPAPLLVTQLSDIGSAQQVITVAADGYGTHVATLTAYQRDGSAWRTVFGPWTASVGRNGVAPPGEKREGDGRTPSGTYGFDFMFGTNPNPGVQFPFRTITGTNIVWDDDSASPNYNRWIDTNTESAGTSPEPMYVRAYRWGAVIAYNRARTPGLGSAIFLHLATAASTAGCVALPQDQLLSLLRWLDPARQPRIAIGTLSELTQ